MAASNTVALAMAASLALGGLAVQGLHAQAKPAGYYVGEITVKDQVGYMKGFVPPATKSFQDRAASS